MNSMISRRMLSRTLAPPLRSACWLASYSGGRTAGQPLVFPGGEPDGPDVRGPVPGPKSRAMQAQLGAMQDVAGIKFFGARGA
jgi:hypothetical protein